MADAAQFTIVISALDKASATLRAISSNVGGMTSRMLSVTAPLRTDFAAFAGSTGLSALGQRVGGITEKFGALRNSLGSLGGPLSMLGGGFAAGGLIDMAKKASDYGAALYDASLKTGIAAGALQRLHYVAQQTGVDTAIMDKALEHLNFQIGQAASGHDKQGLEMFRRLGINLKDANGHLRTASSVYGDLSEAIQKNTNQTIRQEIVAHAFGQRMGAQLIPALSLGRQRTKELGDEIDRLRGPMTDTAAKSAKQAQESWTALSAATSGLAVAIGAKLVPTIMPLVKNLTTWVSTHHQLATTFALVGGGLAALMVVAGPVLHVVTLLGSTGFMLVRTFLFMAKSVGTFVQALRLGFGVMEAMSLANPFGLIIAGVVALAAAAFLIWKYWGPIKNFFAPLVKHIVDAWKPLSAFFGGVWAGIVAIFQRAWNYIGPIVRGLAAVGNFVVKHVMGIDTDALAKTGAHGSVVRQSPLVSQPLVQRAGAPAKSPQGKLDVKVDFSNLPQGTTVKTQKSGDVPGVLDTGLAWAH